MRVVPVPCLSDNYAYLVWPDEGGAGAVVDPAEAAPVLAALARLRGAQSTLGPIGQIWLTHHHFDHVGGVEGLCDALGALEVIGSDHDGREGRLPGQTRRVRGADTFALGGRRVEVLENPGHTLGAISFLVDGELFPGDTLFLGGCGRVLEGTMAMMMESLAKLRALPPETRVFCGHEYTRRNLEFARTIEPGSEAIATALEEAERRGAAGAPTVPGTLAREVETNPFLRFDHPAVARGRAPLETFTALREAKDAY